MYTSSKEKSTKALIVINFTFPVDHHNVFEMALKWRHCTILNYRYEGIKYTLNIMVFSYNTLCFAIFPFILFFNIPVMYLFPTNCSSVTLLCYWGISLISLVLRYDIYLMKIFPFTKPYLCTIQDYFMIPFSHYHKHNCWLVGTHSFGTNTLPRFFCVVWQDKKGEE